MSNVRDRTQGKTPVPLGERVMFLLVGLVIGMVVGTGAGIASEGILGREMGKSLGAALTVAIVMLFSNGYPRVSRGHAAALLAGMAAVGVLLGWLRG